MAAIQRATETARAHRREYDALGRMLGEGCKEQPWNALCGANSEQTTGTADRLKYHARL